MVTGAVCQVESSSGGAGTSHLTFLICKWDTGHKWLWICCEAWYSWCSINASSWVAGSQAWVALALFLFLTSLSGLHHLSCTVPSEPPWSFSELRGLELGRAGREGAPLSWPGRKAQ